MLQLVVDHTRTMGNRAAQAAAEFGVWSGYHIPDNRAHWHQLVRQLYDYWLSIAPDGPLPGSRLPGRRHIVAEDTTALRSRPGLLDVYRHPLRCRSRLCGTEMVRSPRPAVPRPLLDDVHTP